MPSESYRGHLAQLTAALSRFIMTPPTWASYRSTTQAAATLLRCTPADIAQLVRQGLPCAQSAQGPLFEYFDLMNVGRFSQSGVTTPEMVALTLMRFSRKSPSTWLGDKEWQVKVRLPGDDPDRYRIRPPDFEAPGVTRLDQHADRPGQAEAHTGSYTAEVRLTGAHDTIHLPAAREIYRELLADLHSGKVGYQAVCEPLRAEHTLAWDLGMADCMVTNRVFADRLRSAGLRARARRGFILGLVGSEHAWCEVHEDGRWKSMDVTFAARPAGLAVSRPVPAHDEFVTRCFGARFNRILPCLSHDAQSLMYDTTTQQPLPMIGIVSATERTQPA